jgi:hypothetical protein
MSEFTQNFVKKLLGVGKKRKKASRAGGPDKKEKKLARVVKRFIKRDIFA